MQASEHDQVETQLLAFVRKLERNYYDWRVVHLHLSGLRPRNRRDYQLRIAAREFDGLVRKFKSELFQASNGDIFFIWHGGTYADVDPVVLRLRYLFSDDPLAPHAERKAGASQLRPGQACETAYGSLPSTASDLPSDCSRAAAPGRTMCLRPGAAQHLAPPCGPRVGGHELRPGWE